MRLASHHCRPDIQRMLSEMTSWDLTRWQLWDKIEPLGRDAKKFAMLIKAMSGSKDLTISNLVSFIGTEYDGGSRRT